MARLLLVALCIACASAFSPPATLAPRTVVARTASVEMGARGKSQAQRGNINLLKKPKAAPKKAAAKVNAAADRAAALTPRSHAAPHSRTWRAQKIDAAPTFSPPRSPVRSQDIDGDGVISWHEFDGPKTGPMGVDVKSLKDEP